MTSFSLTEIMEQKMKEREIFNDNIEYTTVFNNGQPDNALPIVNTNGNYTNNNKYSNMDDPNPPLMMPSSTVINIS